jgi:hypothetical protein
MISARPVPASRKIRMFPYESPARIPRSGREMTGPGLRPAIAVPDLPAIPVEPDNYLRLFLFREKFLKNSGMRQDLTPGTPHPYILQSGVAFMGTHPADTCPGIDNQNDN